MTRKLQLHPVHARLLDCNLNRLGEALRVLEDILRLGSATPALALRVRALRNRFTRDFRLLRSRVLEFRRSESDPGRSDRFDRLKRKNLEDLLLANFKRAQEACRVLEETLKLDLPEYAPRAKRLRFLLYDLERAALVALRKNRA